MECLDQLALNIRVIKIFLVEDSLYGQLFIKLSMNVHENPITICIEIQKQLIHFFASVIH